MDSVLSQPPTIRDVRSNCPGTDPSLHFSRVVPAMRSRDLGAADPSGRIGNGVVSISSSKAHHSPSPSEGAVASTSVTHQYWSQTPASPCTWVRGGGDRPTNAWLTHSQAISTTFKTEPCLR